MPPWNEKESNDNKSVGSFSDIMTMKKRRVRFSMTDAEVFNHRSLLSDLTDDEYSQLWYTKDELSVHRKEVRKTILGLRSGGGAERLLDNTALDGLCFRGCERYIDLETRFMSHRNVMDAVLEGQRQVDARKLRDASETLSHPGKELATWHASLNAFQCYGFKGLFSTVKPTEIIVSRRPVSPLMDLEDDE